MFVSFPKINGFHNVRKDIALFNDNGKLTKETYRGKIKLHGTNSAVQIRPDVLFAQSRERIITVGDDNMGFAGWVDRNKEYFWKFQDKISDQPMTIFGEWCGSGIMKGVAISNIGRKIFAVFAVQYGNSDDFDAIMVTDPDRIRALIPEHDDIFILPWATGIIDVDFTDTDALIKTAELLNVMVDAVEKCDPWVQETFSIDGVGEGIVFVPYRDNGEVERFIYSKLTFKAKGEKHKVTKQKSSVQIDPEVAKSIDDFADMVLPTARLEQGVQAISSGDIIFDMKLIGPFLAWIGKDVQSETKSELEASGLEWKQVSGVVQRRARDWYINNCNTI